MPIANLPRQDLPAQAELSQKPSIFLLVLAGKISEQPPALPYQDEEAASRSEVFPVEPNVIREPSDTFSQDGYLYLGGASIAFVLLEGLD